MAREATAIKNILSIEEAAEQPRPFDSSDTYKANKKYVVEKLATIKAHYQPFGTLNLLNNRFTIDVSREEINFSKAHAKAYAVSDATAPTRACIAYVVEDYHPYRDDVLHLLRKQPYAHMMEVLDAGIVYVEAWHVNRFVIIYAKPDGVSLASLLEAGQFYKPTDVLKRLVLPIATALHTLETLDINHGCVNPRNVFITPTGVVLGDCIAEPSGEMQPLLYEPIEHIQAMPQARGNGSIASDMYALAMLALDAVNELASRKALSRDNINILLMTRGSYASFVNEVHFQSQMIDFLRGVLVENATERWKAEQLILCAGGKRFNLIPPNPPRDSNRPHGFDGKEYFTLRTLAQAYCDSSDTAIANIRDVKLVKWLETIPYRSETKNLMEKISSRARRITENSSQRHEIISRAVSILDPQAPLRYQDISVQPSHFPQLICFALQTNDLPLQALFRDIIQSDVMLSWRELHPSHFGSLRWEVDVIRSLITHTSLGFGMERLLYEMNPTIPCLSSAYLPYYVTTAKTMLLILDSNAANGKEAVFHDRHLMAFIAMRSAIRKDVKIQEYSDYPAIYDNVELKCIVMLARAQEKTKVGALHGLSAQAMLKMIEIVEIFHSREVRTIFSRDLQTVLPKGNLAYLIRVLQNTDHIAKDATGHLNAKEKYRRNTITLAQLKNKRKLWQKAHDKGVHTAFIISLMVLFGVSYQIFMRYGY